MSLAAAKSFAAALLPLVPHAAVFVFDRELRLEFADGGALLAAGYEPATLTGLHVCDVVPGSPSQPLEPSYRRALAGEEFAVELDALNGRPYRLHGAPVRGEDGRIQGGVLVVHETVSPAEQRLTNRLRQQSAVAELGKQAVTGGTDLGTLIEHAARLVSDTLSADVVKVVELLPEQREFLIRFETTGDRTGSRRPLLGSLAEKTLATQGSLVIEDATQPELGLAPDLLARGVRSIAYVPIGPVSDPFGMLGAFHSQPAAFSTEDVHFLEAIAFVLNESASRERTDAELRRQALHDAVTGLPNRTLLDDRLEHTLAVSARVGLSTAVLFIDLDRFKHINDSLGHQAGDEVLRAVATRLHSVVRRSDTVARFGGDEFVIAAAALGSEEDAVRIAKAVLTLLEAPILLGGEPVYVRASVGVCFAQPDAGQDPRALLHEADAAMYRAKARGRNRFELVGPSEPLPHANRVIAERDLRQALADGDLRIVFQPFVRLHDGAAAGAEVLLRWQHPTEGYIRPGVFLDIAEETGLIVPIGEWMLRHACRHAARWQHDHPDFLLTVNVSASQLSDPGIVSAVEAALAISGLRPEGLGLELTEQVLVGDEHEALSTLNQLKALGVTLLLDDFGTGFSSLSHLKRFPIDVVKIDRSFTQGLDEEGGRGDDAAIVAAIVGMSRATGKRVIPEGVETEAQVRALIELGCDTGQGYFFSCPMKVRHFTRWLAGEAEPLHVA